MVRRTCTVVAAALTLAAVVSAPASASCALDERGLDARVADAKVVFVGDVLRTSDDGRTAVVSVNEVWKGTVPAETTVHGGPSGGFTSVDRSYAAGTRYLFVLWSDDTPLQDNSCSATTEYSSGLAQYRPAGWHQPTPIGGAFPFGPAALGFLILGVVGIALLVTRLARRARPSVKPA